MTKTGTRFQKYIEFTSLNGGACGSIGPFENGWLGGSGGPDGFGRSVRLAGSGGLMGFSLVGQFGLVGLGGWLVDLVCLFSTKIVPKSR